MQKLLLRTFLLWVALTSGIAVAIRVGNQQALPSLAKQLHLADCLIPCWAGIILGKTSRKDAVKYVTALSGTLTLYSSNSADNAAAFSFKIPTNAENDRTKTIDGVLYFQNDTVMRIRIPDGYHVIRPFMPSLTDIIAVLGFPSCLYLDRYSETQLIYVRTHGILSVSVAYSEYFQLTQPVVFLEFIPEDTPSYVCNRSINRNSRPWRGYLSWSEYENMP
jgi:hypothetical protein